MLRGSSPSRPGCGRSSKKPLRRLGATAVVLGGLAEVVVGSRPSIDRAQLQAQAEQPIILGAVSSDGSIATAFGELGQQQQQQEEVRRAKKQQGQVQSRSALMQRIQQMPGAASPSLVAGNEGSMSMFEHFEEDDKSHAFEVTFSEAVYGSPSCPCVGVRGLPGDRTFKTGNTSTAYPPDAGTHCAAWDDGRYGDDCKPGGSPGQGHAWCAAKWCFVDPCNCAMADKSRFFDGKMQYHGRPVYFSYATCGDDTSQHGSKLVEQADFSKQCQLQVVEERCTAQGRETSCVWTGKECIEKSLQETCKQNESSVQEFGQPGCRCVNVAVEGGREMELESEFATASNGTDGQSHDDVGGRCESWEAVGVGLTCAGKPEDPPACKSRWCFVDPCTCPLENFPAISDRSLTVRGVPAHFSYAACGSERPPDAQLANSCTSLKDYMSCHENTTMACVWDVDRCVKETILKQCKLANEPGSEEFEEHSRRSSAHPRTRAGSFMAVVLVASMAWSSAREDLM